MGRMSELDLDRQISDRLVSSYISEMEGRLEAPYRARAIIFDFSLSIGLAFVIAFVLLVL